MSVRERLKVLADVDKALDHEITRRMRAEQRAVWTVGGFELKLEYRNESQWDADELEFVLAELVAEDVIDARDAVGVIKREVTVSRSTANRLVRTLLGEARQRVEACRHWQRSTTPKLAVTRAANLIPAEPADPTAIEEGNHGN